MTRIGDYLTSTESVPPETLGHEILTRFQQDANLLVLAVVDVDGRPRGLIERNAFSLKMAAAFGRELYGGRPVTALMDADPVVADINDDSSAFFSMSDAADAGGLLGGFIATRDGRYAGTGSVLQILRAASEMHRRNAESMAELARSLAVAEAEAKASSQARSDFLAVMSHEIRTPLNGVLGVARLLDRKLHQEELRPYVQAMLDSGETLLRLLTDALDMSRAEAGLMHLEVGALSLSRLAGDIEQLWRARAEEKALTLRLVCETDGADRVSGDAVRLKQLLNNLVGNALKFTTEGEVTIRLSSRLLDGRVQIEGAVDDSGPGVSPENAARIFAPFDIGEGRREGAGAGLGLTICRQIVEAMGGTIGVTTAPGGGARFGFSLALDSAEEAGVETLAPATPHTTLHVLAADDNAVNRFLVTSLLEAFGCSSVTVENGAEAVEAAAQGAFDLVLMDVQMPVMDGVEATRRIRETGANLPIIAVTANADLSEAKRYIEAGMNAVVSKPIEPDALLNAIRTVMGGVKVAMEEAA